MFLSWVDRVRQRRRAIAEGTLHQDDVDPAAEFAADGGQNADLRKAKCRVQADRRPSVAAADDRNHLAVAEFGAAVEEGSEQRPTDPASDFRGIDVDRVLQGEPIGRAGSVRAGVAIAQHSARALGDQIGQAAGDNLAAAGCDLVGLGRNLLEGRQSVEDVVAVDRSDRGDVALIRGTDFDVAAQMTRIGLPSRKATTFSTIWGYEF